MILYVRNQDEKRGFASSDFFSNKNNGVGAVKNGSDLNGFIAISDLIFILFCWESQVNFKHGSIFN